MATIVEVQDSKINHLSEYAEKVVKYSKHLLECLNDMSECESEHYAERYGKGRRGGFRHEPDYDDVPRKMYDYPRYY